MTDFVHHHETLNRIDQHFVTAGSGPAILLMHGFPDLWLGWRGVMERLVAAGYMVIAPDLRGFGETQGARKSDQVTALDVMGDLIAILDHLDVDRVGVVAHDWGSAMAWPIVQLRPDRFCALASLSVPYQPRGGGSMVEMIQQHAPPDLYFLYFLDDGVAEKELDRDPEEFLRRIFYTNSGERPGGGAPAMRLSSNGTLIDALDAPPGSMKCFPDEDLAYYVDQFKRTGFRGALNTYRSLHRTWELLAGWADQVPQVPTLFIGGGRDIALAMMGGADGVKAMSRIPPNAEEPVILDDIGHFIQHEAPEATSALLVSFFARHHPDARADGGAPPALDDR